LGRLHIATSATTAHFGLPDGEGDIECKLQLKAQGDWGSAIGDQRSEEGEAAKERGRLGKGGTRHRGRLTRTVRYMGVGKEGKMDRSRRGDVGGSYRKRSKAAG